MTLFALCINPLIYLLEQKLRGIRVNSRQRKTAVIAYADDVTVLVTAPDENAAIEEVIRSYEEATGAKLNIAKSHSMAMGSWDMTRNVMNIPYSKEVKVLGVQIEKTTAQSAIAIWTRITNMVRLQAREAYIRDLDLAQRIQYVHTYLLAKIWYTAQVLPAPSVQIRQFETAVAWFIWQGDIFRIPLSTLQKKKKGGWGLTDMETKCRALRLYRIWMQIRRDGEITAEWLRYWNPQTQRGSPPHVEGIPRNLEYLSIYARDKAYVEPPKQGEHPRTCRARIYETLRRTKMAANPPRNARKTMRYPTTDWGRVWANLHETWAADSIKANWYKVIHDILPTNERLHAIRLTGTLCAPIVGSKIQSCTGSHKVARDRKSGNERRTALHGY
jgi:hypothetical protein